MAQSHRLLVRQGAAGLFLVLRRLECPRASCLLRLPRMPREQPNDYPLVMAAFAKTNFPLPRAPGHSQQVWWPCGKSPYHRYSCYSFSAIQVQFSSTYITVWFAVRQMNGWQMSEYEIRERLRLSKDHHSSGTSDALGPWIWFAESTKDATL